GGNLPRCLGQDHVRVTRLDVVNGDVVDIHIPETRLQPRVHMVDRRAEMDDVAMKTLVPVPTYQQVVLPNDPNHTGQRPVRQPSKGMVALPQDLDDSLAGQYLPSHGIRVASRNLQQRP